MGQRRLRLGIAAIGIAAAAAALFVLHAGSPHAAARTATPATHFGSDVLVYRAGAPQLAMLRSEALPALPLPLADALSARVAYDDDVTARLFAPVAGRIVALKAQAGDRVAAGQVLALLDAPDFGTARADLDKARADEERKRLAWERARELGPGEGISVKDAEAAHADYDAARAETARAAQRVRNLAPDARATDGQRIAIASPLAGVVTERNASPALEVQPGAATPLFVVTDPRRLSLFIDVPEKLLGAIRTGARVAVESDAWPGQRFDARIVQMGQVVDPNTRRVLARARVDNPGGKLLPEMFVRAAVLQDTGQAVRVPNSAIVTRGVDSYVFAETQPGRFERRRVELALRGADASWVARGIAPGEKIVTSGALLLDAEAATAQRP